jgi:plasmid stability protein
MNQITIRRLDAAIVQGLKTRAAAAGHSMEQEARKILEAAVLPPREGIAERLRLAMATRTPRDTASYGDSARLLRQLRSGPSMPAS